MNIASIAVGFLLWGWAGWIFGHRDRPEELSRKLPLLRGRRRGWPLFESPGDVMWFAFWPFVLGLLFGGFGLIGLL